MSPARPRVTLKVATSLDGRIAAASGASKWITGPEARAQAHRLRAAHDAVLVGAGTARADDPDLRVRLEGYDGPQPARVVIDPRLSLSAESRLAVTVSETPVIVFAGEGRESAALAALGVVIETLPVGPDGLDPAAILDRLAARGIGSVMVEGGGVTHAGFLRAGLADRLEWFRAPLLLGGDGLPAFGGLGVESPDCAPRFKRDIVTILGDDVWERYAREG